MGKKHESCANMNIKGKKKPTSYSIYEALQVTGACGPTVPLYRMISRSLEVKVALCKNNSLSYNEELKRNSTTHTWTHASNTDLCFALYVSQKSFRKAPCTCTRLRLERKARKTTKQNDVSQQQQQQNFRQLQVKG